MCCTPTVRLLIVLTCHPAITVLSTGYRPLGSCSRAAGWSAATSCRGPTQTSAILPSCPLSGVMRTRRSRRARLPLSATITGWGLVGGIVTTGHENASMTRDSAGFLRFFTLIQSFDRPRGRVDRPASTPFPPILCCRRRGTGLARSRQSRTVRRRCRPAGARAAALDWLPHRQRQAAQVLAIER